MAGGDPMTDTKLYCSSVIIFVLCLCSFLLAQDQSRPATAEERLAAALATAKTDEERAALLAKEKELMTVELGRALNAQGDRLKVQGNYAQALALYRLAERVAEQLNDSSGLAAAWRNIGIIHQSQSNYAQAL